VTYTDYVVPIRMVESSRLVGAGHTIWGEQEMHIEFCSENFWKVATLSTDEMGEWH
jgi:hypothetical protein